MKITEVRVKLVRNKDDRLKAFCSMTLDNEFVVRDIKVIAGAAGYFVAMPSRKMSDHCERCGSKNHLKARFCNQCGGGLPADRDRRDAKRHQKLHADVAHPINAACRHRIQQHVVAAFEREVHRSRLPGYVPPNLDEADDDIPDDVG
jgi:stage V sporulation protein G